MPLIYIFFSPFAYPKKKKRVSKFFFCMTLSLSLSLSKKGTTNLFYFPCQISQRKNSCSLSHTHTHTHCFFTSFYLTLCIIGRHRVKSPVCIQGVYSFSCFKNATLSLSCILIDTCCFFTLSHTHTHALTAFSLYHI